jgi:hypothetical protein
MVINETLEFFQNLKTNSNEKSEIKLYDKYILILSDLKNRDLTETQILNIETELEKLNLNAESENKMKYLKKKLSELQKFLKDKLALISKDHYVGIGVGTGIFLGSIFSMLFQTFLGVYSLLIGINGGMILGAIIGSFFDKEAEKQGRVLTN